VTTLADLRIRFRQILKLPNQTDVDEGDPTQANISTLINEARNRRYAQLVGSYPFRFLTVSTAFTYTALAENMAMPTGTGGRMVSLVKCLPLNVTTSADAYNLKPAAIDELDLYQDFGTPEVYVVDMAAQKLWLRPIPQSNTSLYIYYVAALAALGDTDEPTEFPSEFHQLLAYDAAVMYRQEAGDESAAVLEARAEAIYDSLKIYVERNYQDTRFKQRQRLLY